MQNEVAIGLGCFCAEMQVLSFQMGQMKSGGCWGSRYAHYILYAPWKICFCLCSYAHFLMLAINSLILTSILKKKNEIKSVQKDNAT